MATVCFYLKFPVFRNKVQPMHLLRWLNPVSRLGTNPVVVMTTLTSMTMTRNVPHAVNIAGGNNLTKG